MGAGERAAALEHMDTAPLAPHHTHAHSQAQTSSKKTGDDADTMNTSDIPQLGAPPLSSRFRTQHSPSVWLNILQW